MTTLLALATSRIGIIVIACIVGAVAVLGYGALRYRAGVSDERAVWVARVERERAALSRERAAAQAKIDTLVAERLAASTNWTQERAALEAEIEKEKADVATPGRACAPAISRRLSKSLDRIGR